MMKSSQTITGESPVAIEKEAGRSAALVICEHASNHIPADFDNLGLESDALMSHIAWDPGALDLARFLSESLDATLIHQRFSRLLYDCNRPPQAPGAIPEKSEIYSIPGNAGLPPEARAVRVEQIYNPFMSALATSIGKRLTENRPTALVTIHSFTPVYHGKIRETQIGILHDSDSRLADAVLSNLMENSAFVTRRNDPYGPADGVTHTLIEHGIKNGLHNVMVEVRNDLLLDKNALRQVQVDLLRAIRGALESIDARS